MGACVWTCVCGLLFICLRDCVIFNAFGVFPCCLGDILLFCVLWAPPQGVLLKSKHPEPTVLQFFNKNCNEKSKIMHRKSTKQLKMTTTGADTKRPSPLGAAEGDTPLILKCFIHGWCNLGIFDCIIAGKLLLSGLGVLRIHCPSIVVAGAKHPQK